MPAFTRCGMGRSSDSSSQSQRRVPFSPSSVVKRTAALCAYVPSAMIRQPSGQGVAFSERSDHGPSG